MDFSFQSICSNQCEQLRLLSTLKTKKLSFQLVRAEPFPKLVILHPRNNTGLSSDGSTAQHRPAGVEKGAPSFPLVVSHIVQTKLQEMINH